MGFYWVRIQLNRKFEGEGEIYMVQYISVENLRHKLDVALDNEGELAILDVREIGQYAAGHLFFATHVPYSRLEFDIEAFVPRRNTSVVVYDDADGVSQKAVAALYRAGYEDISILEGGAPAWMSEGYTLYQGVNLPSKTFGELVEIELGTPRLSADQLARRQKDGDDLIILDGRTPEEYRRFNIPGGMSCPNAELPLRFDDLVPSSETTVIINCAGRTRSIIGAQTLINFGVSNKVFALENGTQGWSLADLELEYGANRIPSMNIALKNCEVAQTRAKNVAKDFDLTPVDWETVVKWQNDETRTLFLMDVRSQDEYMRGHLPGSVHAPGGQLVQATDRWVGVRGSRIVVYDDTGVRAICTAHWLKQMGWDVYVLEQDTRAFVFEDAHYSNLNSELSRIDAKRLLELVLDGSVYILDLRTSKDFESEHIIGANWCVRPLLDQINIPNDRPVVLVADDHAAATLVAEDLRYRSIDDVYLFDGGMVSWREAGGSLVEGSLRPTDTERIDFAAFTAERHSGNKSHMRQYLEWEINLVNQLDEQERRVFKVIGA